MSSADAAPTDAHAGQRANRRGRSLTVLLVVTAVVVTAITVSRMTAGAPAEGPPRTPPMAAPLPPRVVATEALLRSQADAVLAADRESYVAGWSTAGAARQAAVRTFRNLALLGVASYQPRLDTTSVVGTARSWTASVDVTWALRRAPAASATSRLRLGFSTTRDGPRITSALSVRGDSEPVWLMPGMTVHAGPRTMVVATSAADAGQVTGLLADAVTAVGDVLPGWHGELVAYAPPTSAAFGRLIGQPVTQYRGIAAVTTTVDGSSRRSAATAIVLNPAVFERLDAVGAQVVVTHEATHLATGAATVTMPLWVAEGFADYVGIGSTALTVPVAGRVALRLVRRSGPPAALPDSTAFAAHGPALEAAYEESWLAALLIARRHGERGLVAFYRDVSAHPEDLAGAFRRDLHTTVATFTAAWQHFLGQTARVG